MGHGQTLRHTFPAVADSVPRAREALSTFARAAGASAEQLDSIRLAVSEAATNVVVHAYDDDAGRILLDASLSARELWVLIADDGLGMRPQIQSAGLGFGLSLMSQVCDETGSVGRRFASPRPPEPRLRAGDPLAFPASCLSRS